MSVCIKGSIPKSRISSMQNFYHMAFPFKFFLKNAYFPIWSKFFIYISKTLI